MRAFQRRFRPEKLDGVIDGQCRAILLSLLTGGDKARRCGAGRRRLSILRVSAIDSSRAFR